MVDSKNVYLRHAYFVLKTVIYSANNVGVEKDASFFDMPGLSGGKRLTH